MSNSENNQVQWKSPAGKYWKELSAICSAKRSTKPSAKCSAESWDDLVQIHDWLKNRTESANQERESSPVFIFRGQGPHGDLKTSIERAFEEFEIDGNERPKFEKQLIRSFQRKAPYHLKGVGVPTLDNTLEWLSLMQNHGAPTRLLDWTYSFYRALYNAISKSSRSRKDKLWESELWVMNTRWFTNKTENKMRESINKAPQSTEEERERMEELLNFLDNAKEEVKDYKGLLANNRSKMVQYLMGEEPLPLVYNVTPIGLNERIIYQQGTFVLPGDITKCFMQNLEPYKKNNCKDHLFRIAIKLEHQGRNRIIEELNDMNINEAVLFPGLDGFARSLWMELAFLHKR
ncbi:MAG: hypothetical protein A2167_08420 [Planctomycetes bacterium RBG_13_46_10]|nr:MAG: hypothetical protein A2167_08420 [Planctomycetes bacterium RBG_13_46_10]